MDNDEQELRKIWEFMKDFWQLMKTHHSQPLNGDKQAEDNYWHSLIDAAGELGEKYDGHPLVIGQLKAYLDYQDGIWKKALKERKRA